MKILKDFGVRALLAIIAAIGYYTPLFIVFIHFQLSTETMLALLGAASSPWLLAMGFYFGTRTSDQSSSEVSREILNYLKSQSQAAPRPGPGPA